MPPPVVCMYGMSNNLCLTPLRRNEVDRFPGSVDSEVIRCDHWFLLLSLSLYSATRRGASGLSFCLPLILASWDLALQLSLGLHCRSLPRIPHRSEVSRGFFRGTIRVMRNHRSDDQFRNVMNIRGIENLYDRRFFSLEDAKRPERRGFYCPRCNLEKSTRSDESIISNEKFGWIWLLLYIIRYDTLPYRVS